MKKDRGKKKEEKIKTNMSRGIRNILTFYPRYEIKNFQEVKTFEDIGGGVKWRLNDCSKYVL